MDYCNTGDSFSSIWIAFCKLLAIFEDWKRGREWGGRVMEEGKTGKEERLKGGWDRARRHALP